MEDAKTHSPKKSLTSAQFEKLLQRLSSDRQSAARAYEGLRWLLIKFFECNSCLQAEDLADDTLNRIAQKLEEIDIHDVKAYAWGIAKKIKQEAHNREKRLVPFSDFDGNGNLLADHKDLEEEIHDRIEKERRARCFDICMMNLPPADRELLIAYHTPSADQTQARQELAKNLGLTIGALRIKLIRLREKMENCTTRCLGSCGNTRHTPFVKTKPTRGETPSKWKTPTGTS